MTDPGLSWAGPTQWEDRKREQDQNPPFSVLSPRITGKSDDGKRRQGDSAEQESGHSMQSPKMIRGRVEWQDCGAMGKVHQMCISDLRRWLG